jgi:hypothetical protein
MFRQQQHKPQNQRIALTNVMTITIGVWDTLKETEVGANDIATLNTAFVIT